MKSICGIDCDNCGYGKSVGCKGCNETDGCPFGKKCIAANYIQTGGAESYIDFKNQIIREFNDLHIEGLPQITELYELCGEYVNLAYPFPNGYEIKVLDDRQVYIGTQVECTFDGGNTDRCFGLVAGLDFLLVCEYGEHGSNPEIVLFKRR